MWCRRQPIDAAQTLREPFLLLLPLAIQVQLQHLGVHGCQLSITQRGLDAATAAMQALTARLVLSDNGGDDTIALDARAAALGLDSAAGVMRVSAAAAWPARAPAV